jgi:isochorismate pyruvate lyase
MILHQRELMKFREEIDAVDAELFALIQKRFEIVDRVIDVKNNAGIPAMLPDRIEQVVQNVLKNAKHTKVPSQTVENLWRTLITETIAYEDRVLSKK